MLGSSSLIWYVFLIMTRLQIIHFFFKYSYSFKCCNIVLGLLQLVLDYNFWNVRQILRWCDTKFERKLKLKHSHAFHVTTILIFDSKFHPIFLKISKHIWKINVITVQLLKIVMTELLCNGQTYFGHAIYLVWFQFSSSFKMLHFDKSCFNFVSILLI